jgi:ribosome biogenesis GTPase
MMNEKRTPGTEPKERDLMRGTIIRGIGSFYTVRDADRQEYTLRCKKKFRREKMTPMVGDEVLFTPGKGEEHGWLEEILPRKTECLRPPVANVTRLVIMIAPVPEPDAIRKEILRYFADASLRARCVDAIRREKERLSWDRFCTDLTAFAEQL